jgi:hypothetical protein
LLGRQGVNLPGLRLADFRFQQGIYHADKWDRFSWFGFRSVLNGKDDKGLCKLKHMAGIAVGSPNYVITDVEALLIRAMGLKNINQNNFHTAEEWTQIKAHEAERFIDKIAK